jgi:hypothetical protein
VSDLSAGLLVMLVGVFLVTRSVTQDDTGRTLIDRILGKTGTTPAGAHAVGLVDIGGGGNFTSQPPITPGDPRNTPGNRGHHAVA